MIGKIIKKTDMFGLQKTVLLNEMIEYGPGAPEYAQALEYLERLNKMETSDRPRRVSGDTIVNGLFSMGGILLIVIYEQKHVFSTKAFGFRVNRSVTPN